MLVRFDSVANCVCFLFFASFAFIVSIANQTATGESVFLFRFYLFWFSWFSFLCVFFTFAYWDCLFSCFRFRFLLFANTQWFSARPADSSPAAAPVYVNEFITGKLASAAEGRQRQRKRTNGKCNYQGTIAMREGISYYSVAYLTASAFRIAYRVILLCSFHYLELFFV